MKVAISSNGKDLESPMSEVFARCPYFIIVELREGEVEGFEVIKNEFSNQMGGAGISVSQLMAEKGVGAVIAKNLGPRAFEVLKQFGIEVWQGEGKIRDVLEKFIEGKLEKFE